jgi:hypothetical protein
MEHLRALDAARTEMDVENGEDPGLSERIARRVVAALTVEPVSEAKTLDPEIAMLRNELLHLRHQLVAQSEEQLRRSDKTFAASEGREYAIRSSALSDAVENVAQKGELDERSAVQQMLIDERRMNINHYASSVFQLPALAAGALGFVLLIVARDIAVSFFPGFLPGSAIVERSASAFRLGGIFLCATGFWLLLRSYLATLRFLRFRVGTLEECSERGYGAAELLRIRNLLDRAVDVAGIHGAADWFEEKAGGNTHFSEERQ